MPAARRVGVATGGRPSGRGRRCRATCRTGWSIGRIVTSNPISARSSSSPARSRNPAAISTFSSRVLHRVGEGMRRGATHVPPRPGARRPRPGRTVADRGRRRAGSTPTPPGQRLVARRAPRVATPRRPAHRTCAPGRVTPLHAPACPACATRVFRERGSYETFGLHGLYARRSPGAQPRRPVPGGSMKGSTRLSS